MSTKTHYHQTQLLSKEQEEQYEAQAASQDRIILRYFERNPGLHITCEDILQSGILPKSTPITSIRRALTNLHKKFRVIEEVGQRDGRYGRPITRYKLL
jgi:hypothetical protein